MAMKPTKWTCPDCHEEHIFPKNGPFKRCCMMNSLNHFSGKAVEEIESRKDPADWWKDGRKQDE